MKSKQKSLQKFTDKESKISKILSLEKILLSDVEQLSEVENKRLNEILTEKFNNLKGVERDKFYKKIEAITTETTKNQLWESNHIQITWAISTLMQEYGRMPSKTEIATKTELSRQTIHKHLSEYAHHPQFLEQQEQFNFMCSKVLARVFYFAVNGDMAAAKLFLNFQMQINKKPQVINNVIEKQNNFIQVNQTVLSQEAIKQLTPIQLNMFEKTLKKIIPFPKTIKDNKNQDS